MRRITCAGALVTALAACAERPSAPDPQALAAEGEGCARDEDCYSGFGCANSACARYCVVDAECAGHGLSCAQGTCGPLRGLREVELTGRTAGDKFGYRVAASGSRFVVGAHLAGPGVAYVIEVSDTAIETTVLTAADALPGDVFGFDVAIDGDVIVIGAFSRDDLGSGSGAAYVFRFSGSAWQQEQKLLASDGAAGERFGAAVAIDGDVIAVQAEERGGGEGGVYVFRRSAGTWNETQIFDDPAGFPGLRFGADLALDAGRLVIGVGEDDERGTGSGSARVYREEGTSFVFEQLLVGASTDADDALGEAVAIAGDTVLLGAPYHGTDNQGAAYVFVRTQGVWNEVAELTAPDAGSGDNLGEAVSLNASSILVGARDHSHGTQGAGAAYVFARTALSGIAVELLAPTRRINEGFGQGVALGQTLGAVVSFGEDPGDPDGKVFLFGP